MSDKQYKLIKAICLVVIAGSSLFIAMQLVELNEHLWDIVRVIGNSH
ncbi:hypothetical protein GN156_11340 [bacterium LRH843]|nr:hypothetical protein [bacterium LRH843]